MTSFRPLLVVALVAVAALCIDALPEANKASTLVKGSNTNHGTVLATSPAPGNHSSNGTSPSPSPTPNPNTDPCSEHTHCGSCLKEKGCEWCLIPENECRSVGNSTENSCTVFRNEDDGCYGLINVYLTKTQKLIAYIVLGVLGLACILIGYKLVRPVLFLGGFAVGFFIGTTAVYYIVKEDPTGWRVWVTGVVVGVVLGAAATMLLKVGLFILGGLAGAILAYHAFGIAEREVNIKHGARWAYVAMAGGALLVGGLALLAEKVILIVGTSIAGSFAVCMSILHFTPYNDSVLAALSGGSGTHDDKPAALYVYLGALGGLTIAGICFQFWVTRDHKYEKGRYVRVEKGEHTQPLIAVGDRDVYGYNY